MDHDPLCPIEPNPLACECRTCDLIAKVRADTLEKVRNAVKHQQHSDDCYYAEGVLCNCEIKETLRTIDSLRSQP